jgi:CTP synthase
MSLEVFDKINNLKSRQKELNLNDLTYQVLLRFEKKFGKKTTVSERHRHRYEFNNEYRDILEKNGLTIAGTSPDGKIVEAIEIKGHPFFIGTQFHPEYISRPLDPHPLFVEFARVCLNIRNNKEKK